MYCRQAVTRLQHRAPRALVGYSSTVRLLHISYLTSPSVLVLLLQVLRLRRHRGDLGSSSRSSSLNSVCHGSGMYAVLGMVALDAAAAPALPAVTAAGVLPTFASKPWSEQCGVSAQQCDILAAAVLPAVPAAAGQLASFVVCLGKVLHGGQQDQAQMAA